MNLMIGDVVAIPFGTRGTVLGPRPEGRIEVSFEESSAEPAKNLNVQSFEIQPAKELL
ncbi:unnamed protein product, partial [Cladocopium goreaui]